MFNSFFTNLSSTSNATYEDSEAFIADVFLDLKVEQKKIATTNFSFVPTTSTIVEKLIAKLDNASSPGLSGIPTKILKAASSTFAPILTNLFNNCIRNNIIPIEWKSAVVTPLYKQKSADKSNKNNYRGISVLSLIAKLFEKILATQITIYLNVNKILFKGQHGFRSDHSCETALHELLSDLNMAKDKRLIAILLFIDFRKAFDLVDSKLLLLKLFHYGFDNNALALIKNYFESRQQQVKYRGISSSFADIKLGVPQGSVLGPLFFLIFINDLPFLLELLCKLFADDTTLYLMGDNVTTLINKFKEYLKPMLDWCKFNKLDINWDKTFFMFVTNKRVGKQIPNEISIENCQVKVVDNFKFLGVTIDNKLNFDKYSRDLRLSVNKKLYSIKRLFYLCTSVKIQFFKTFVLPYFDYCLSLLIYFPKSTIQRINNCFNLCLFKLLNFKKSSDENIEDFNENLSNYGLFSFQHRVMIKIFNFAHSMINNLNSPVDLQQVFKQETYLKSKARSASLILPVIKTHFGEKTFQFFFIKLFNNFGKKDFFSNYELYISSINRNLKSIFIKFVKTFPIFNVFYKNLDYLDKKSKNSQNTK
jgi:hypothetical protein